MFNVYVNYVAVVLSALIPMVMGFLWYGPLFGKPWMKMVGMTEKMMEEVKKKNMTSTYLMMFCGALVMSFVLAMVIDYALAITMVEGMEIGGLMWCGFVGTTMLSSFLFSVKPKPWMLYFLDTGYYFVCLVLMGGLIGYMG